MTISGKKSAEQQQQRNEYPQARHPKINNNKIRQIKKTEDLYCCYYSKNNYIKNQLSVRAKTNRNNVAYSVALQVVSV